VYGEGQWEIVLGKSKPITLGTPEMLCSQFLREEDCKFFVDENICLIFVHCLRESVGPLLGGLWELKLMLCKSKIANREIWRDMTQKLYDFFMLRSAVVMGNLNAF
jgi:hypothetical protein